MIGSKRAAWQFLALALLSVVFNVTLAADISLEDSLRAKQDALRAVKSVDQNMRLLGDAITGDRSWAVRYGKDITKWPPAIQAEFHRRYKQSKVTTGYMTPTQAGGFDDEELQQEYEDLRRNGVALFASALSQLGSIVTLIGLTPPEAAAHLVALHSVEILLSAMDKNDAVTDENAAKLLEKYKDDWDSLAPDKKHAALRTIEGDIAVEISEELRKKAEAAGGVALTKSSDSVTFDAATGTLTFTNDYVVGLTDASSPDTAVGASVSFPQYRLGGAPEWGAPGILFVPNQDEIGMQVGNGASPYMVGDLPSLIYLSDTNTFYGVLPWMLSLQQGSQFIDGLQQRWWSTFDVDSAMFLATQLTPTSQFGDLTQSFTISGTSGFTDSLGIYFAPEPSSLLLLLGVLPVVLVWTTRRHPAACVSSPIK